MDKFSANFEQVIGDESFGDGASEETHHNLVPWIIEGVLYSFPQLSLAKDDNDNDDERWDTNSPKAITDHP